MRILAIVCGIILLLPGLCFLGFGIMFTFGKSGIPVFGIIELVIGGIIMWIALALFTSGSR